MSGTSPQVIVEVPPSNDAYADKEAALIDSGKYKRDQQMKTHLHYCALVLLWFGALIFMISSSIWIFHLLAPHDKHFLDADQLSHLQNILISALGSSIVTDYGKRMIEKAD